MSPIARLEASNWSGTSRPCSLFQKPYFQWALTIAMNIAPTAPAAPRGVKNPNARERPPPNSPRIIRLVQNQAGLNPCFCIPCTALVNPEPPNQPNLCAPWTASVSPATRRRRSNPKLSVIAIQLFLSLSSVWNCCRFGKVPEDCNLLDCSLDDNCKNVKYSYGKRIGGQERWLTKSDARPRRAPGRRQGYNVRGLQAGVVRLRLRFRPGSPGPVRSRRGLKPCPLIDLPIEQPDRSRRASFARLSGQGDSPRHALRVPGPG